MPKPKNIKNVRKRGRPPIGELTQPVAFRLPPSLAALATQAALKQGLSRNKFVEGLLRQAVADELKAPAPSPKPFDLFG